jgi:hypothetical protein
MRYVLYISVALAEGWNDSQRLQLRVAGGRDDLSNGSAFGRGETS